jgi:hypothetical protein
MQPPLGLAATRGSGPPPKGMDGQDWLQGWSCRPGVLGPAFRLHAGHFTMCKTEMGRMLGKDLVPETQLQCAL